jgi:hypothetical protein
MVLDAKKPRREGMPSDRAAAVRTTALGMQKATPRSITLLAM